MLLRVKPVEQFPFYFQGMNSKVDDLSLGWPLPFSSTANNQPHFQIVNVGGSFLFRMLLL